MENKREYSSVIKNGLQFNENQSSFQFLEGKGKVKYKDADRSISARINLRVEKDKQIWVSASMFGFEGVRALITPDSIQVINRISRSYYQEPISKAVDISGLPVNFELLQQVITAQLLVPLNTDTTVELEKHEIKLSGLLEHLFTESIITTPNIQILSQKIVEQEANRSMKIYYSEYQQFSSLNIPMKQQIVVQDEQDISVEIELSKVEINGDIEFPFSISKSYKRESL